MTTAAYKRWSHPSGTTLLLIEGVSVDLFSAVDSLELLAKEWASDSLNPTIIQALATAAIVSYARVFKSGVRLSMRIGQDFSVSAEQLAVHERIIGIRDKHVSHPVNSFETHSLFISYHVEAQEPVATSVSAGSMILSSLAPDEIGPFIALCHSLLDQLHHKRAAETEKLLEFAKQLTPSEIRALPEGPIQPSDNPWHIRSGA